MATYQVDVTMKPARGRNAERNVFLEANSPAKASKDALAVLAAKYPDQEVLESKVSRLAEPLVTQGLKFMPNVYQPPAQRLKRAIEASQAMTVATGYITSTPKARRGPKETVSV